MGKLVTPKVYLVGFTAIHMPGILDYLRSTGNAEFVHTIQDAREQGISDGEILCSFYAKLCYASLTLGHNDNITRVRDIPDNIKAAFGAGHGSVFEHCYLNFVVTDCSRVFTHELVRHRVGTSFSQTSGRYVRTDSLDIVFDPILDPVRHVVEEIQTYLEEKYQFMVELMKINEMKDFDRKKKITSALRRVLPNGQSNEIGFGVNLRALRHLVQIRTARGAEWEIRNAFHQVYDLVKGKFPTLFQDAKEEMVEGAVEITGMKLQPYDKVVEYG